MAYPGHRIGPNGETYNPTLKAPKEINLEQDCMVLNTAMKGAGTDEDAVIDILGHRTLKQRLAIRDHYKATFGEDLIDKLTGELTGNFEDLVQMLLKESATTKAKALYKAMAGAGTKESVIIEILCTASNKEIRDIKRAYVEDPSRTLESDIKDDLGGDFERLAVALLQGVREELSEEQMEKLKRQGIQGILNKQLVSKDVEDLYKAGEGRLGTDEGTFIRILSTRNVWHLQAVTKLYEQKTKKSLMEAIESETSGTFESALKFTLLTCLNRIEAYATLIKEAMDGLGTADSTLMRIIATRCEVRADLVDLGNICQLFEAREQQSLEQRIREETSGDYRKLLLALLGSRWQE
ncbi:annexin A7/11 [Paragonimus westermani]|uniref:Annexin n=1 Tax=Paragonimus westermani TaxID=34504 RepID=A0A5J4NSR9_9TREM|nr:annexin A7/11 [Paragonimus westermani]